MNKATETALDVAGDVAMRISERIPGPFSLAMMGVAGVLKAAALMMRDHGKSVEEIIHDIKMPRRLDTTWRADIDQKIGGQ